MVTAGASFLVYQKRDLCSLRTTIQCSMTNDDNTRSFNITQNHSIIRPPISDRQSHSCQQHKYQSTLQLMSSIWKVTPFVVWIAGTDAFGVKEPVSALLQKHVSDIARLKEEAQLIVGNIDCIPYNNDVFYLRYCLDGKGVDTLKENLAWRIGPGKEICKAAVSAFESAISGDQKWNNEPVRNGAPGAESINKYITPTTSLTTSSTEGDLVYCIRAGLIDDASLMSAVSVCKMVDFFLYCKEVNALVANDRSLEMDKVLYVITANDLSGLQLIGGDATFRKALGEASKKANTLYPALSGPTLLLNLPRLVSALVKLFTPLFPAEVNARLKFKRGPLADVDELADVTYGGKKRDAFLADLKRICY